MHGNRVWEQWVGPDTLALWHPDGRTAVHRFSYRIHSEVIQHNWSQLPDGYATTRLSKEEGNISLHALAMGLKPGRGNANQVDHIDKDSLNSRDWNLRLVPSRLNGHNRNDQSELGVCIQDNYGGFRVCVRFHGPIYTPTFKTLELAIQCRDVYLAMAGEYDEGLRGRPSTTELQTIADHIKEIGEYDS